jgi:hypothetical protein
MTLNKQHTTEQKINESPARRYGVVAGEVHFDYANPPPSMTRAEPVM